MSNFHLEGILQISDLKSILILRFKVHCWQSSCSNQGNKKDREHLKASHKIPFLNKMTVWMKESCLKWSSKSKIKGMREILHIHNGSLILGPLTSNTWTADLWPNGYSLIFFFFSQKPSAILSQKMCEKYYCRLTDIKNRMQVRN